MLLFLINFKNFLPALHDNIHSDVDVHSAEDLHN